jgi:hypothetical protein
MTLKFCVHPADPIGVRTTIENLKDDLFPVGLIGVHQMLRAWNPSRLERTAAFTDLTSHPRSDAERAPAFTRARMVRDVAVQATLPGGVPGIFE